MELLVGDYFEGESLDAGGWLDDSWNGPGEAQIEDKRSEPAPEKPLTRGGRWQSRPGSNRRFRLDGRTGRSSQQAVYLEKCNLTWRFATWVVLVSTHRYPLFLNLLGDR